MARSIVSGGVLHYKWFFPRGERLMEEVNGSVAMQSARAATNRGLPTRVVGPESHHRTVLATHNPSDFPRSARAAMRRWTTTFECRQHD